MHDRSFATIALTLFVALTHSSAFAAPQACPPAPPNDVVFEITLRTYDADAFSPAFNFVDTGPVYSTVSAHRSSGALPSETKTTDITVVEQASGSLSFSLANAAEVMAKRVDGHNFGCGGRIVVDAYVRGSTGTPYYVTREHEGYVEANFPQGFGRADAQCNNAYASSVNGQGQVLVPVYASQITTGSSGVERVFGTGTFSYAGRYEFDLSGIIFQSLDFCLPFSPCPTLHYWARGSVSGGMEVGIGTPPCTGTLEQGWCAVCERVGWTGVRRRFAVSADITPVGTSTSCDCCEYRQFIRKEANYRTVLFGGVPHAGWYPRRPNAAGDGTHCDTWAEDSDKKPVLTIPLIEISYGYRQPTSLLHQPYGVYVAVDRPLTQICTSPITSGVPGGCHFEARDAPQMSTGLPGTIGTKKYIEFEGRLISKHACTPNASHDVVLARKRWTMCCESVGTGVVASCAEGGPPQFPPLQFSSSQEVGPRGACLLFAKVNGSVLVFAIVDVSPQLPLGAGAVVLTVSGSNAIEADDGPFEVSMFEGDVTDAYFPFRLAAPVSGVVTATIDIFGEQATWQVDLTPLGLGPVGYCTPGTTTNGCTAVIASAGTPSSAASSGFVLSSSGIEGQRGGLIFYGVNGRNSIPWKPGSTSFLCVKSPTQRMLLLNSGGTSGACNGAFATDFLAFLAANPTSLGQPFASGNVCDAQAWFRDPSAPGTTNLSNAIEWTMLP